MANSAALRRVTAGAHRHFSRGQREVATGAHVARERVDEQGDAMPLIAKELGDGRGQQRRIATRDRRRVRRGEYHHAALCARRSPQCIDDLHHFAAALADQRHHRRVDIHARHQCVHERRLAATRRREDAHALANAAGQ